MLCVLQIAYLKPSLFSNFHTTVRSYPLPKFKGLSVTDDAWGDHDAHYAAIVQNSFDAIIAKDLYGRIRSWNRAAQTIFGWMPDEVIGKSIRLIIPPEKQAEEDSILARIHSGEVVEKFETTRQHKSGKQIRVAVTISPLRDRLGNIVGASKIAHDTTQVSAIRARLEDSEQMFRTLANGMPQLAWVADPTGHIFWYNDRWYEYTGTSLEEMQGWGWTKVHHPEHVERVRKRIQQSWDSGQEWEDTFPLRGRDGSYRWFLSRAKPLRDDNGRVRQWYGTNTDITAERETEQQNRLLMTEINHRAKNMIAVVQALVCRTVDPHYSDKLTLRLRALSGNQDILARRNWAGAPIGELISSQLAVVGDLLGTRVLVEGDLDVFLAPSAAEAIGLAMHELATNATKYGALSTNEGIVHIRCAVDREAEVPTLTIQWREQGGPITKPPVRSGFGSVMIERNPRLSLGAEVTTAFPATGFSWRLVAPLAKLEPGP